MRYAWLNRGIFAPSWLMPYGTFDASIIEYVSVSSKGDFLRSRMIMHHLLIYH